MMGKKKFVALGLVTFLLVFSGLIPVIANDWGSPLATDPTGDAALTGEDILSVDAQYSSGFVYYRFKMNDPLLLHMEICVIVDFDKNTSTGGTHPSSDIGYDFQLRCKNIEIVPNIRVQVQLLFYGHPNIWVMYNMTANNGSVMDWSDPGIVPYLDLAIFANGSQGDVAFGVNWTWLTTQMALDGVTGDGCSMYLEFYVGQDTDWCPDRTGGTTDYLEWNLFGDGDDGIPGFSAPVALFCLLTVLAVMALLDRKRITF